MRTASKGIVIAAVTAAVALSVFFYVTENASPTPKGKVFVMYAASLIQTFENKTGPSFQRESGYSFIGEAKGSVQIANMIIDQQRAPDVFVSAGPTPIEKLIDHNQPLAHWYVNFGSAEVVIAYTPKSPFFNDLEKARKGELLWYKVLAEDGLKFRRTDPELDPRGYFTIIIAKLANLYYNDTTIKDKILGEDRNPKQLLPEETLRTTLDSGQIDAIPAYKHEAVARGLPYIELPKEINLSDPMLSNLYKKASYTLGSGQTVYGGAIYFSVTIPDTSKNTDGAIAFVNFIFSEKGRTILTNDGLVPIKAVFGGDVDKVPPTIKSTVG